MIRVPDLPAMATYQNNDLPLLNYSTLSLPLSTTQINNKAGLFGDPENIHYTVTFQPLLKSHQNAPFPEAGLPHKHLKALRSCQHLPVPIWNLTSYLSFSFSLLPNITHTGSSCSLPVLHTRPRIENFLVSFPNICWAFATTDDFIKWLAISY